MKEKDKLIDNIIDTFYNEQHDDNLTYDAAASEVLDIQKKLTDMAEIMDKLDEHEPDMPINIMAILEKADNIKNKRKKRLENLIFIGIAAAIMFMFGVIAGIFGIQLLLGFEIVVVALFPFMLIPISYLAVVGGGNGR